MKLMELKPVYVYYMPEVKEEGILYISEEFSLAIHLCACGCGQQSVTPFNDPREWTLTKNNGAVSLRPSIGNFNVLLLSVLLFSTTKIFAQTKDSSKEENDCNGCMTVQGFLNLIRAKEERYSTEDCKCECDYPVYNVLIGTESGMDFTTESYCVIVGHGDKVKKLIGRDMIWYVDWNEPYLQKIPKIKKELRDYYNNFIKTGKDNKDYRKAFVLSVIRIKDTYYND